MILCHSYLLLPGELANKMQGDSDTKLRVLMCLQRLLELLHDAGEEAITPFVPRVVSFLKQALGDPTLANDATALWRLFLSFLSVPTLGQYLSTIVVSLLPSVQLNPQPGQPPVSHTKAIELLR